MKEILQMRDLLKAYLDRDERYRDRCALALYRFYESDMPYQLALRMNGTFDLKQFNPCQHIEGELIVDIAVQLPQEHGIRLQSDEALVGLCDYLSWFHHLESRAKFSLKIVPSKSGAHKQSSHSEAFLAYHFKIVRRE